MHDIVMHLEGLKELLQDFFFCFLSTLNLWVLACIVLTLNVIDVQGSISIVVNFLESFLDYLSSKLVHRPYHHSNKLIKVNITISIQIKGLEQTVDILVINVNLEILNALFEFISVK
jgi:hypothetical protein